MGSDSQLSSPWLTLREAAAYLKRGRRFLSRQVHEGRLRAARVGGRGELLFRSEWLDTFIEDQARPVEIISRRRA